MDTSTPSQLATADPSTGKIVYNDPSTAASMMPNFSTAAGPQTVNSSGSGQVVSVAPAVVTTQPAVSAVNTMKTTLADSSSAIQTQAQKNAQAKADAAAAAADQAKNDQTNQLMSIFNADGSMKSGKAPAESNQNLDIQSKYGNGYNDSKGVFHEGTFDSNGNFIPAGSKTPDSHYDAAGNYILGDGSGYYNTSGNFVKGKPLSDSSSDNGNFDLTTQAGVDAYRAKQQADLQKSDQMYQDINGKLNQFSNGTLPLNPDQQAQIDAAKVLFQQAHDAQILANKNYEGGVTQANVSSGLERYSPVIAMGQFQAAVNSGLQKIAQLDAQNAKALGELRLSFETNNLKVAQQAYEDFQKNMDSRNSIINSIADAAQKHLDETITQNQKQQELDATKRRDDYNQKQKPINDIATEAAKYGAPKDVLDAINKATDLGAALTAASTYLQDPTSLGGMYSAMVREAQASGKTPMSPSEFVSAQKYAEALATEKASAAYSYTKAYNAALAKNEADSQFTNSDKNQQKLEKQYADIWLKQLSNRSGGLGLQDAKVNQAIHLRSLYEQYKKVDSKGNVTYEVPTSQYAELVMGLANLISPTGSAEADRAALMAKTAKGDLKGALQYITGQAQTGNTQSIIKNLVDSIDRQGTISEQLRDQDVSLLRAAKPTDLDETRAESIEKGKLSSFINPAQNIAQAAAQADSALQSYGQAHPEKQAEIASNEAIVAKTLGHQPKAVEFQEFFPEYFTQ